MPYTIAVVWRAVRREETGIYLQVMPNKGFASRRRRDGHQGIGSEVWSGVEEKALKEHRPATAPAAVR